MNIGNLPSAQKSALLGLMILSVGGCRSSQRSLQLPQGQIKVGDPIAFGARTFPLAGSKNGHRIAVVNSDVGLGSPGPLTVIDTDSHAVVANRQLSKDEFPALFDASGSSLFVLGKDAWIKWDLASGTESRLDVTLPSKMGGGVGWNADRTIVLLGRGDWGKTKSEGVGSPKDVEASGQVFTQAGTGYRIQPGESAGFDQFGNAWVGKGRNWTEIDAKGSTRRASSPPRYLVGDQGKTRGSSLLEVVEKTMSFKGADAYVDCIWLTDQRAGSEVNGRFVSNEKTRGAALVFAGPDVRDYGFVPGRDMVYVISDSGSYLVPLERVDV